MAAITLVIGNRNYSSWSLRGWLALAQTGEAFEEVLVPLDRPDTAAAIRARSPSGRVPVLKHDGVTVWESLAIAEFLAETYPRSGLWPDDPTARAAARAVAAEMHAGFVDLRRDLPMDMRGRYPGRNFGDGAARDIRRVAEIWNDCRTRFGAGGPFLFGRFTAADAMFAPVVSRFATYDVPLDEVAAAYRDAVRDHPPYRTWAAAAENEPWVIEEPKI